MAFSHMHFFSDTLGMNMDMSVIFPNIPARPPKGRLQVLYLLHGLSGDYSSLQRNSSLERYLNESRSLAAIVTPSAHKSFYANLETGEKYWDYISREIPMRVRAFLNVSAKREDTFVSGISMGGYGAMKLALSLPDKFAAVTSISGAVDLERLAAENINNEYFRNVLGGPAKIRGSKNDLFKLAEKLASSGKSAPRMSMCCGTEDFLYQDNVKFVGRLRKLGFKPKWSEGPGAHEWDYWDKVLPTVLKNFNFKKF